MMAVIAKMQIQEGKFDEAVAMIKDLMNDVAKEEGTLAYSMNRSKDEPNTIVFIERYKDKDALKAHGSTPHFKEFGSKIAGVLAGKPEITYYEELGSI